MDERQEGQEEGIGVAVAVVSEVSGRDKGGG
jgi:hypothetical protein